MTDLAPALSDPPDVRRWWKHLTARQRAQVREWLASSPPAAVWRESPVAWAYTEMPVWWARR